MNFFRVIKIARGCEEAPPPLTLPQLYMLRVT